MAAGIDITEVAAVGALMISGLGLAVTYMRTVRVQGSDRQRIKALEDGVGKLATTESVAALGVRFSEMEADVKLAVTAVTEVSVVKEKLSGLDRVVTLQLDEVKHVLRRLEDRSFDPAAPINRRRSTPTS